MMQINNSGTAEREFCIWLKGFLANKDCLPNNELEMIQKELSALFIVPTITSLPKEAYQGTQTTHLGPSMGGPFIR